MTGKRTIVGIHIANRSQSVPEVQRILTECGCSIRTRLGLHEVSDDACSPSGLLILEMYGDDPKILEMQASLKQLDGVSVQQMVFGE